MGMTMQSEQRCPKCGGKGTIINDPCQTCKGKGKVRRNKTIRVNVPARHRRRTVASASVTRATRAPTAARTAICSSPSTSATIRSSRATARTSIARCRSPSRRRRSAQTIEVPTLDGKVRYTIPEGTQTGTVFRLRGKGIPYVGYKTRGDQFVTVVVETPTKLTKEQKELLRKLEDVTGEASQPKRKSFFDKLKGE